ncbi:MAG: DUF58 domain-containing protein [Christensenellaceae bacterium]|nr:DUF58 domain-containing protein [Christensenellaceae bacterium]
MRITYFSAMGLCLLDGMANGIRGYYLAFFILLFLLLCAAALSLWTAGSFAYLQRLEREKGFRGESLSLKLSIHNDQPFPFTAMKLRVEAVSREDDQEELFSLLPGREINFEYQIPLRHRGEHLLGLTTLTITDGFGLLPIRFDMRRLAYYKMRPLLVYPRILQLVPKAAPSGDEKQAAAQNLRAAPFGENLFSSRPYRAGDALKRINWKLSFRLKKPFTKEYDAPLRGRSYFFLHNALQGSAEGPLDLADLFTESVASLAAQALRSGRDVSILNSGGFRPLALRAGSALTPLLEHLAKLPFDSAGELGPVLAKHAPALSRRDAVYLVSAEVNGALLAALRRFFPGGGAALILVGGQRPPEGSLPPGLVLCQLPLGVNPIAALSEVLQ